MSSTPNNNNSTNNNHQNNVIRPFGCSSMECGYCKGERASLVKKQASDCSKSYGMLADKITPVVYEGLVNRGWRRSGIHLYKPSNFESCCPTLTIRLLADQFQATKSQQKLSRKVHNLLHPPQSQQQQQQLPSKKKKIKASKLKQPPPQKKNNYYEQMMRKSGTITVMNEQKRQPQDQ